MIDFYGPVEYNDFDWLGQTPRTHTMEDSLYMLRTTFMTSRANRGEAQFELPDFEQDIDFVD